MKSLKGHLLLAKESLLDPHFARSVVLIFDHNEYGAAGIILNRPLATTVGEIARRAFDYPSDWQKPLNMGGPVSGPFAAAHTIKEMADLEVMPGVYGALLPEHLQQLIRKQQEPTLFVLNYSGWGPGQLEQEIIEDSWDVMPAKPEHIFYSEENDLWELCRTDLERSQTLQSALGIKIKPLDPRMN